MAELKTILCIDDEQDILEVTRMTLEVVGGYHIAAINDGNLAPETAKRIRPDIILLDVMMPGIDGPATLKLLQAEPATAHIPVIFMTAKIQSSEINEYLNLGAAGVIAKPFDPMSLPQQVQAIWEKHHG